MYVSITVLFVENVVLVKSMRKIEDIANMLVISWKNLYLNFFFLI